jgi:thiosulfate dehydrogenase [quinone] large subunit
MTALGLQPSAGAPADHTSTPASAPHRLAYQALALLRILLGLYFLWAFVDKLFGLGFATPGEKAWIHGGSPTLGFLSGAEGPFAGMYHAMAGTAWANISFMAALLLIGTGLTFGVANRLTTFGGTALYLMMWTVVLPPTTNPVFDDHVIQAVAILVLGAFHAGEHFGLGRWWNELGVVRSLPVLK